MRMQQTVGYKNDLQACARFFSSGATQTYLFRKEQLEKLRAAILSNEEAIYAALEKDLKKNREESWITEIGFVLAEIKHTLRHLKQWMKPQRVGTNLMNLPSRSYIYKEPLGVVLIIAPWNYPVQLLLTPLVGAIAAGNCVVLKPSELAPATASVIKHIITHTFDPGYILYVEGEGSVVVPQLMEAFRFDHIFFTGGTTVGRMIYEQAAKKLTPVTLELGGKSPCVVESDAHIKVTAKRIALAKFSNAGQMCVAPDYLLVHQSIKNELVQHLKQTITQFFTEEAHTDYHYGRIVNDRQFNRLIGYLKHGRVVFGGKYDAATKFMEPTLLEDVDLNEAVMGEEIFGPVLPIIPFQSVDEAKRIIDKNPNPLAFYLFTQSAQKEEQWLQAVPFGGGCVNNVSLQVTNFNLPFGGRGASGIGAYHGKFSFDVFSHQKAVMKTPTWIDPAVKYPPFKGKLNLFKKVIG